MIPVSHSASSANTGSGLKILVESTRLWYLHQATYAPAATDVTVDNKNAVAHAIAKALDIGAPF
jgi:hypothetical protein